MGPKLLTLFLIVILHLVGGVVCRNYKHRSQLQFSSASGGYINILVAINPDVAEEDCLAVVQQLQSTLSQTSTLLHSATGGAAHFSSIKILLPRLHCLFVNGTAVATAAQSYAIADLKVTENHPLAKSLPWTRQYRGCSFGAEDVFIPATKFLLSPDLSSREKGGLLLREWAQFRYGVFQEFGHHDDPIYGGCYKGSKKEEHFSACSSTQLPALFQGQGDCRRELENQKEDLLTRLNVGTDASSLMFMPHLSSVTKFCNNDTHNKQAPNKQNVFCGKRSVSHVLETHPDIAAAGRSYPRQVPVPPTEFQVIKHNDINEYKTGVLFLIEDTPRIREENRLRYLKQSMASVISLLPLNSMVKIGLFDGVRFTQPFTIILEGDTYREAAIRAIIDVESLTLIERMRLSNLPPPRQGASNQLRTILDNALTAISNQQSYDWQIVLLTNGPSTGFSAASGSITASPASLIAITLDGGDPSWMELYASANTRSILSFTPNCNLTATLCAQWSGLMVEAVMDAVKGPHSPQWHKVGEAIIVPGQISTLLVENLPPVSGDYQFFITVLQPQTQGLIRVFAPNGMECGVGSVHGYNFLLGVRDCGIASGNWSLDLSRLPTSDAIRSQVTVWVETTASTSLNVNVGLEADRRRELDPNGGVAVYARVSDTTQAPIVFADVKVDLFTAAGTLTGPGVPLKDNGIDPDVTQNDGVYSGILTSFSANPDFHVARVTVVTSGSSKVVQSLRPIEATLLDPNMAEKCCGSQVPISTTTSLSNGRLTSFMSGFRTRERFDPESLPPSRIGTIQVVGDDGQKLWLEFRAPGAYLDQELLSNYDSCCTHVVDVGDSSLEISSCHAITPANDCSPVEPGNVQDCALTRNSLANNHLNSSEENNLVTLNCGIRGVNSQGLAGLTSMSSFVVEVTFQDSGSKSGSNCKSLSDDCLPITLFWGLIGCIGGLVLILLVLVIFWCVWAQKQQKQDKGDREKVLLSTNKRSRLQESSTPDVVNPSAQPPPANDSPLYNVYVNKAFITDGDGGMKLVAADGQLLPLDDGPSPTPFANHHHHTAETRHPQTVQEPHHQRLNGVSVVPVPPVRRKSIPENMINDDMVIFKSNPYPPPKPARPNSQQRMASVPIPKHRLPRPDTGYANGTSPNQDPNTTPTTSQAPPKVASVLDPPVYASVNRNGRSRTPLSSPSPNPELSTFRPSSAISIKRQSIPPHFGGRSKDDTFIPSATRYAPKRYDAFPSSDSDTYSDLSRTVSAAPSHLPPTPPIFPPNRASRPPPYNPPPPPPKKVDAQEEDYDDDSEHWDDEDFDFQPVGVSYA